MRETTFTPAPEKDELDCTNWEKGMSAFQRRTDGLHLTHENGKVYDLLNEARIELGIKGMSLGLMGAKGGQVRVDVCSHNGEEVMVTAQCPNQKQQIRLRTKDQALTKQAVADHLGARGVKVRVR